MRFLRLRAYLAARDLHREGKLEGLNDRQIAELVLARVMGCQTLAEARDLQPGIDWDELLAFIERLIPLIMMLIELFG